MGTHPIFESDFDCLTEVVMFKKLKDKTKSEGGSNLSRSDSMTSLDSAHSATSSAQISTPNANRTRMQQNLQNQGTDAKIRQLEAKLAERAVMIRKLEHDREKLSSQLERSQESASQAKKIARESEKAVKTE